MPLPRLVPKIPELPSIPETILREGRLQYETSRAENIAYALSQTAGEAAVGVERAAYGEDFEPSQKEQWEGLASDMREPGQTPESGNKFLSTLGKVLEPFKYFDVPVELAAEAIFDPLEALVPGEQFNWIRGSAKRDNFEGWKAVRDMMQGKTTLIDAANEIADAYEKRPFLAQLGLGMAYGVGIAQVGKISRLGALAKPLMYTLDPAQVIVDVGAVGVKKSYRAMQARGLIRGGRAMSLTDELRQLNFDENSAIDNRYVEVSAAEKNLEENIHNPYKIVAKEGGLHRIHKVSNALYDLRRSLGTGEKLPDTPGGTNGVTPLLRSRDLAVLELQNATFARTGMVERMTMEDINRFRKSPNVVVQRQRKVTDTSRDLMYRIDSPKGVARSHAAVESYIETIQRDAPDVWKQLQENPDAKFFDIVNVNINSTGGVIPNSYKVGIGARPEKLLVLTERLRFYNKHFGDQWGGIGLLPDEAQPLRAIAATQLAAQKGTRPIDIMLSLEHSPEGSPMEWLNYMMDPDSIDVVEDLKLLYGFEEFAPGTIGGRGYLEDMLGIEFQGGQVRTQKGKGKYVAGKLVDIAGPKTKDTGQLRRVINLDKVEASGVNIDDLRTAMRKWKLKKGGQPSNAMQRKGLRPEGKFETTTFADFIDAVGEIRTAQILNGGDKLLEAADSDLFTKLKDWQSRNHIGMTTAEKDNLYKRVIAAQQFKHEAVTLANAHSRLSMRRDAIKQVLIDSGWADMVKGNLSFRKIRNGGKHATWLKRFGKDGDIGLEEAQRLFRPKMDTVEYAISYEGLERMLSKAGKEGERRGVGLLTHEIMLAAAYNKQMDVKSEIQKSLGNSRPGDHPVHQLDLLDLMDEGNPKGKNATGTPFADALAVYRMSDITGAKKWGVNPAIIRNTAREPLLAVLATDDSVRGIENISINVPEGEELATVEKQRNAVYKWLGIEYDEGTPGLFEINPRKGEIIEMLKHRKVGLSRGATKAQIIKSLEKAHRLIPQFFGRDHQLLEPDKLKERLDIIASIIQQDGDRLLQDLEFPITKAHDVIDADDYLENPKWQQYIQARRLVMDYASVDVFGRQMTATDIVNGSPHIMENYAMMTDPGKKLQRWFNIVPDEAGGFKPGEGQRWGQKAFANLWHYASGGQASVGMRFAAKAYIGWKKSQLIAEQIGRDSVRDITTILNPDGALGMTSGLDDITEAIRLGHGDDKLGLSGHQFFSKVKLRPVQWESLGPEPKIIGWADTKRSTDVQKLELGQTVPDLPKEMSAEAKKLVQTGYKKALLSTQNTNQYFKGTGSNIGDYEKMMTHTDVILSEVPVQYLDEIYELTMEQRNQIAFLQNISEKADALFQARTNTSIPELIRQQDNAAEYLPEGQGYIPRLRRIKSNPFAAFKQSSDTISNNYRWWLEERKFKSIWDTIAPNPAHHKGELDDGYSGIMDDLAARLGQYVESIHKSIADDELSTVLQEHSKLTRSLGKEADAGIGALSITEKVLDIRLSRGSGSILITGETGHQLDELDATDLNILSEELRTHIENITGIRQTPYGYTKTVGIGPRDYAREHELDIRRLIEADAKRLKEVSQRTESFPTPQEWKDSQDWAKGLVLSDSDMKAIQVHMGIVKDGIQNFPASLAKTALPYSRWARTMKAGWDAGVLLIHGMNALTLNPATWEQGAGFKWDFSGQKAWGKAAYNMIKFMKDPDFHGEYMSRPEVRDTINQMRRFVTLGHAEPLAAQANSNTFTRWRANLSDRKLKMLGLPVGEATSRLRVAHRAEASFIGTLDVMRTELWQSQLETVKRQYDRAFKAETLPTAWSDDLAVASKQQIDMMTDLGATINKMTGVYDQTLAGLTPNQSAIESAFLFFAPMYRRASYGVIADLFRGSKAGTGPQIRRVAAMRQISGLVMAGAMMASLSELVMGNDGAMDPTKGSFMKFEVNGVKSGIGTAWYTLARLGGDLGWKTWNDPDGDLDDLSENPILMALRRRGRSQLAPGGSTLVDLISGSTFIGDPLRDPDGSTDWTATVAYAGRSGMMPFWLDGIFGADGSGKVQTGFAEFIGLQSFPINDYEKVQKVQHWILENEGGNEKLNAWRKEKAYAKEPLVWNELDKNIQFELETQHPELIKAMAYHKERWGLRARGEDRMWADYSTDKGSINLTAHESLAMAERNYEVTGDGHAFRREVSNISGARRASHKALLEQPRYEAIAIHIDDYRKGDSDKEKMFEGDILYDWYISDVVDNEENEDDFGNFRYDIYKKNRAQFYKDAKLIERPKLREYIETRSSQWYSNHHIVNELDRAKKTLQPYWGLHNTILKGDERILAGIYYDASPMLQRQLKSRNPIFREIEKKVDEAKTRVRTANPLIDEMLVRFYGHRPKTRAGAIAERQMLTKAHYMARNPNGSSAAHPRGFAVTPAGRVIYDKAFIPKEDKYIGAEELDQYLDTPDAQLTSIR